uniref:SGNH hydrolase-type esterase domain-containing protein n=1 Tax=Oryzias latipes TaxID=8090 RepID=A0A3P9K030_ORYLA
MADGMIAVVSPDQTSAKITAKNPNPNYDLDSQSLSTASGIITDLKEDIRRLRVELEMKDALLSKFMDVSYAQSKRLSCLSAALQDTAPWDPSTCIRPSSSSTPKQRSLDEEVVVRRPRRSSDETRRRPPVLSLSNRFASLAPDSPAPSSATTAAQTPPDLGSTLDFPALRRYATVIPEEDGRIVACSNPDEASRITAKAPPSGSDERPRLEPPASSRAPAPSSRRRILKEAVRFHCSKSRASPLLTDHRPQGEAAAAAVVMPVGAAPAPASPPPLFAPSTAIIGDSIIRKVRFFNAVTHCFPGATVPDILEKLPDLLRSLPSTVKRLILHVGFNDTSYRQSETTKKVFIRLFNFLNSCPLTVFISGPLPSLSRGQGRFSRLLSLSTWLQSVASLNKFVFIDNFNLF